jgi:hypothetical protein
MLCVFVHQASNSLFVARQALNVFFVVVVALLEGAHTQGSRALGFASRWATIGFGTLQYTYGSFYIAFVTEVQ